MAGPALYFKKRGAIVAADKQNTQEKPEEQSAEKCPVPPEQKRTFFRKIREKWANAQGTSALLGIIVLFIGLSIASPFFLSLYNIRNILVQMSVVSLLAGGVTFVILTAGIDLSTAANLALVGTVVGVLTVKAGVPAGYAMIIGVAIGGAVGLFNGVLISKVGLPALIVTLGGLTLWRGLAFQVVGGYDISGMVDAIGFIGRGNIFYIPMPVIIMFGYYIVTSLTLKHTKLGRYVYALGSNEEAARRSGINVSKYKIFVYIICGVSAGLAALVLIGRLDSSGGKIATNWELDAIAAVILGGTSLFGGRGNIWGSLLGALLMTMIRNGMNLLGISPFIQMITLGLVIIGAVWIDVIRLRGFKMSRA
jgi:ribose transport system permease protein